MIKAFHGKQEIKDFYIERIKQHAFADEIIKGQYWENGRGCAVGCTIHSDEHSNYETELGIPIILARLEDNIFESLPNELAKTWPLRFLESIKVGSDLSKVWPKFAIFILTDASQCNLKHEQCKIVADCFQRQLNGENINWSEIKSATATATATNAAYAAYAAYAAADADAAYAAAYAAADAAYAADAYAADADAAYAADAAAYAADAAAYAAADSAKQKARMAQSEKLLELLREAN